MISAVIYLQARPLRSPSSVDGSVSSHSCAKSKHTDLSRVFLLSPPFLPPELYTRVIFLCHWIQHFLIYHPSLTVDSLRAISSVAVSDKWDFSSLKCGGKNDESIRCVKGEFLRELNFLRHI